MMSALFYALGGYLAGLVVSALIYRTVPEREDVPAAACVDCRQPTDSVVVVEGCEVELCEQCQPLYLPEAEL